MTDVGDLAWRTSTRSSGGDCVEIATEAEQVLIRDSKDPTGPVLAFDLDTFREFITYVKEQSH